MDYSIAEAAFRRNFPKGYISCTDFRSHYGWYLINVALELGTPTTASNDSEEAWRLFRELLLWLRDNPNLFDAGDRFGVFVGWPESVRKTGRQIMKGGATRGELSKVTDDLDSATFQRLGGRVYVLRGWDVGVY